MTNDDLHEYPLSETVPETILTPGGTPLDQLTVENALAGKLGAGDLAIAPETLRRQAEIARSVNRHTLSRNFERAAELTRVPQTEILELYELLRPGRARDAAEMRLRADAVRKTYGAEQIALLIEEAAAAYERRGMFAKRF